MELQAVEQVVRNVICSRQLYHQQQAGMLFCLMLTSIDACQWHRGTDMVFKVLKSFKVCRSCKMRCLRLSSDDFWSCEFRYQIVESKARAGAWFNYAVEQGSAKHWQTRIYRQVIQICTRWKSRPSMQCKKMSTFKNWNQSEPTRIEPIQH